MSGSATLSSLELPGLDGANPLGFLAALGTLAVLRQAGHSEVRLGWKRSVTWAPVIDRVSANPRVLSQSLAKELGGRAILDGADKTRTSMQKEFDAAKKAVKDKREEIKKRGLRGKDRKAAVEAEVSHLIEDLRLKRQSWLVALKAAVPSFELAIGKHIDCTSDEFRIHANGFLADAGHANRETIDLLSAFGTDACLQKSGRIAATPFCFITGSGHQYFLDTVRQLMDEVTPDRVHAALFEPWTYGDKKLSMRWDPIEDRRYALMDRDPTASDNESSTVWMANLLA